MIGKSACCAGPRVSWHRCGEGIEPSDQSRILLPPNPLKAQITVAERACGGDLPNGGCRIKARWLGLQHRQCAFDLAGLMVEPLWLVFFIGAPAALIDLQN